jgi:hypothetical protein
MVSPIAVAHRSPARLAMPLAGIGGFITPKPLSVS